MKVEFSFAMPRQTYNVLFTGLGGSIGMAIQRRLTELGCGLFAISHEPQEGADAVADFGDDRALADAIGRASGMLDALVFAHGMLETGPVDAVSPDRWRRLLDVNLNSIYAMIHAALPRMEAGSSIVIISSTAAFDHSPIGGPHYTASKWAVNGIVRHLSEDLGPRGIRINSICPGLVDNPMGKAFLTEDEYLACFRDIPLQRPATPDEIARVAIFLMSEGASFVTGANIPVSGGYR